MEKQDENTDEVSEQEEPKTKARKFNVAIVLICVLVLVLAWSMFERMYASKIEKASIRKLRSIGNSQLEYQRIDEKNNYGSFDAIRNNGIIGEGYTLANMIDHYSLTWNIGKLNPGGYFGGGIWNHTFTIVAYPDRFPSGMRTFGISDDQLIRVYNPANTKMKKIYKLNQYYGPSDPRIPSWDVCDLQYYKLIGTSE